MNEDMRSAIVPKSDQWNFDDFLSGPITFKITGVRVKTGGEQPVEISLEGTEKFYRPCKSMARVLVAAWGADSSQYAGRSLTLYGDPSVKWAGMCVGGIRISHMSDIGETMTMALTVTRANKKPFTVKPLRPAAKETAPPPPSNGSASSDGAAASEGGAALVTFEQAMSLGELLAEKKMMPDRLLSAASKVIGRQITALDHLPADFYQRAVTWIESH